MEKRVLANGTQGRLSPGLRGRRVDGLELTKNLWISFFISPIEDRGCGFGYSRILPSCMNCLPGVLGLSGG